MQIKVVPYDDPDAQKLIAEVQQEYVVRYGSADATVVRAEEFAPPLGLFVVGYLDGVPVATGAWRVRDADGGHLLDGDAEIKRMYVSATARGRGLARAVLAELESTARAAGRRRMVLETGTKQPEAIALYESSGYTPMSGFGYYADEPDSRYFSKSLVED
ncbi:GNAT family N-acetyltransferase [Amycolatopsis suaedae]|uniref:GNAT family N-acetyltransferase n=1 Tax=Amycolatopsis suaedae TaxID=2510978 RepID=A0A4Q7JCC9_9PSEU|nr:GNAT family N-acetyltransferase [Amycolatopsis suaedae]RZQ64682.1 GNAT family N-acetyltransferase [Amycolatopsis suaedae]